MRELLKGIFKGNAALWVVIGILFSISCILMFSAISSVAHKSANYLDPFYGHVKHLAFGLVILILMSRFPYKYLRKLYLIFLPVVIVILFIMPLIGVELNGGVRAIRIAGFDVQPQEFAKIFIIMLLADILSIYQKNESESKTYFWIILGTVALTCLPIAMQNMSTAVMICMLTFIMMFIGRMERKRMLILLFSGLFAIAVIIGTLLLLPDSVNKSLPGHMSSIKGRIENVIEDIQTPDNRKVYTITDENRQPMHAKIAIANGRNPSGPGNSIQRDYLPLAFSDYIFAILIEESGIYGAVFVMTLYLIILFIAGSILKKSKKIYPALLSIGFCTMIVMQAYISMCVAVGLGPVTGQPLPLISRGGTSILSTCFMLGVVLSVTNTMAQETMAENEASENETTEDNITQNISESIENEEVM
ncbi:MAG: FtsW/RodA/SpoVE family cell cycle protein [Paludibacteraceae bacterium]|nr:FtsW/RodA/SpoVE family cell cycle protein [Paludibacteraceae bacterium]